MSQSSLDKYSRTKAVVVLFKVHQNILKVAERVGRTVSERNFIVLVLKIVLERKTVITLVIMNSPDLSVNTFLFTLLF
jgi:hypothetical protein